MRLKPTEASKILAKEASDAGLDMPSSSTPTHGPTVGANTREYWAGVSDAMISKTERSRAYLRAYISIAGEMPIYAEGILLSKGRMPLDKSVMHRLCRDGYVEFIERNKHSEFKITSLGKDWIEI